MNLDDYDNITAYYPELDDGEYPIDSDSDEYNADWQECIPGKGNWDGWAQLEDIQVTRTNNAQARASSYFNNASISLNYETFATFSDAKCRAKEISLNNSVTTFLKPIKFGWAVHIPIGLFAKDKIYKRLDLHYEHQESWVTDVVKTYVSNQPPLTFTVCYACDGRRCIDGQHICYACMGRGQIANNSGTPARATQREISIYESRKKISDRRLITFFRSISTKIDIGNQRNIIAVSSVNKNLDSGLMLNEMFYTKNEYGYSLLISKQSDYLFEIEFGCCVGPTAGDGGKWSVAFNEEDGVESLSGGMTWIS